MSKKAQEERKSQIEEFCPADPPISCNKLKLPSLNLDASEKGQAAQIQVNLTKVGIGIDCLCDQIFSIICSKL